MTDKMSLLFSLKLELQVSFNPLTQVLINYLIYYCCISSSLWSTSFTFFSRKKNSQCYYLVDKLISANKFKVHKCTEHIGEEISVCACTLIIIDLLANASQMQTMLDRGMFFILVFLWMKNLDPVN